MFFFDVVGRLLGRMAEKDPDLLKPYLANFERCVLWTEGNTLKEILAEECDPITNRCYGRVVQGWRSNHLGPGSAVSWCTAQVFTAMTGLRKLIRDIVTRTTLEEFGGRLASAPNSRDWDQLMDADLLLGPSASSSLKKELLEKLLQPLKLQEEATLASLLAPKPLSTLRSSRKPFYSSILFGPPGTAKTTICTSIASYLGWNFVTIDTADFMSEGLEQVQ